MSRQDFQEATIESPCRWPRPLAAAIRAEATVDKQKERYKILCLYLFQQFEELLKRKMPGVKKTIPLLTPDWRLLACGLTAMGMDRTDDGTTTVLSTQDEDVAKAALAVPGGLVWGRRVVTAQPNQHPHQAASALLPAAARQHCPNPGAVLLQPEQQQRESILDSMLGVDIRDLSPDVRSMSVIDLRANPVTITAVTTGEVTTNVTIHFFHTGLKRKPGYTGNTDSCFFHTGAQGI